MLLPITGLYAAVLGVLIIVLVMRVIAKRFRQRIGVGDGGDKALLLAIRAHGNAIESIPIALILLAALELNQGSLQTLHAFGMALVIARLLHAYGLSRSGRASPGRLLGTALTLVVILGLGIANVLAFVVSQL